MFRRLTLVLAALALVLTGCGPAALPATPAFSATQAPAVITSPPLPLAFTTATPAPVPTSAGPFMTIVDGMGRTVVLNQIPQRIVSMAPSNTEILFAVGAGKQVVGRDEFSDFPAEAKSLQSIGGSMGQYNTEQIAALKPDLVLAAEINTPEQVKTLEDLGLTVYYLKNPTSIEGMYINLQTVAQMTGHETDATTLIDSLKARVAAVDEKIKSATTKPVVFYEIDASDPAKPYTDGPGTFIDQLITQAGGANFATIAKITNPYPQVSLEQIVSINPDIILLGDSAYGATPQSVGQRPGWGALKAVKDQQIFAFDDNLVSRPGPRLVDGLEALAKLLHPELFK